MTVQGRRVEGQEYKRHMELEIRALLLVSIYFLYSVYTWHCTGVAQIIAFVTDVINLV